MSDTRSSQDDAIPDPSSSYNPSAADRETAKSRATIAQTKSPTNDKVKETGRHQIVYMIFLIVGVLATLLFFAPWFAIGGDCSGNESIDCVSFDLGIIPPHLLVSEYDLASTPITFQSVAVYWKYPSTFGSDERRDAYSVSPPLPVSNPNPLLFGMLGIDGIIIIAPLTFLLSTAWKKNVSWGPRSIQIFLGIVVLILFVLWASFASSPTIQDINNSISSNIDIHTGVSLSIVPSFGFWGILFILIVSEIASFSLLRHRISKTSL